MDRNVVGRALGVVLAVGLVGGCGGDTPYPGMRPVTPLVPLSPGPGAATPQSAPSPGPGAPSTVGEILRDPAAWAGRTVTVSSEVDRVLGPTAFGIGDPGDDLLVVPQRAARLPRSTRAGSTGRSRWRSSGRAGGSWTPASTPRSPAIDRC
jgi:hypothetical protein